MATDSSIGRIAKDVLLPFIVPSSTIVALLYYFGLVRTVTFYDRFDVPVSLLGLATADLVGRSLDVFIQPLRFGLLGAMVLLITYRVVRDRLEPHLYDEHLRGINYLLVATGLVGSLIFDRSFLPSRAFGIPQLTASIGWTVSVAMIWLNLRQLALGPSRTATLLRPLMSSRYMTMGFVSMLGLGLFVSTAHYARIVGNEAADDAVTFSGNNPEVVLTTELDLGIDDLALAEEVISEGTRIYRYSDLRLLTSSTNVFVVYPATMQPDDGVIVLRASEILSLRIGSS